MSAFWAPHTTGVLAAILESSGDAIISRDLDGIIRGWNRAATRLYGHTAEEAVGQPGTLIIPADRHEELPALLARAGTRQPVESHETVRRAKDGRLIDVALSMTPILDDGGQVVGAMTIAHDLTARKRTDAALRTSELRWRSVVDSAVDGIIVIDARGRIEAFNRGAERLFGYRALEVLGHNVNILMPAPYREEHDGYLSRYLASGKATIIGIGREVTGRRRDGTTFPLDLSVGEMSVGGEPKFTGILHDLSARVQMEEQLREQAALAHLGEMAAVIAHEVKNPLAGVRGAIEIIGRRLGDARDGAIVGEILGRIDALNGLMTDLLRFARPPQPKLAPVALGPLVTRFADLLRSDPLQAQVRVDVRGTTPPALADADLLQIVFQNLLLNSAQAMGGAGTIRVLLDTVGDACQVVVRDDGPGMPPGVREKIFTPFFTTKARGTGLGLPTVKRLIDAHGGQIAVECPPEGGTVVTIRLPVRGAGTSPSDQGEVVGA
jgi:two-component system sensor kinase FixL